MQNKIIAQMQMHSIQFFHLLISYCIQYSCSWRDLYVWSNKAPWSLCLWVQLSLGFTWKIFHTLYFGYQLYCYITAMLCWFDFIHNEQSFIIERIRDKYFDTSFALNNFSTQFAIFCTCTTTTKISYWIKSVHLWDSN